jgi:hypothetical protein
MHQIQVFDASLSRSRVTDNQIRQPVISRKINKRPLKYKEESESSHNDL